MTIPNQTTYSTKPYNLKKLPLVDMLDFDGNEPLAKNLYPQLSFKMAALNIF